MESTSTLPMQACQKCFSSVMDFLPFLKLCRDSVHKWNQIIDHFDNFTVSSKATTAYVLVGDEIKTVGDRSRPNKTLEEAFVSMKQRVRSIGYENKTKFRRVRYLQSKKRVEVRIIKKDFDCPECGKHFDAVYKFNDHISNLKKQCCERCYEVVDFKSFKDHLSEVHNVLCVTCPTCDMHFDTEVRLRKHLVAHQQGDFICPECKMTFLTNERLTTHSNYRHGAVQCLCNKQFTNKGCYFQHMKTCKTERVNQKYICDYCNKEFKTRAVIVTHIALVHIKKRSHQCHDCGKTFITAQALSEHSYSHNKVKDRFKCPFCKQNFSTYGGYNKHLKKKHYELDPTLKIEYCCHLCGKALISELNLQRHITAKHINEKKRIRRKREKL